jgi:hypothetical protein
MAQQPDFNSGFSTGVKYWLLFLIGLTILGYSPLLSIGLGLIGGLAGGTIAAFLDAKTVEITKPTSDAETRSDSSTKLFSRRQGFGGMRTRQQQRQTSWFRRFFRKK